MSDLLKRALLYLLVCVLPTLFLFVAAELTIRWLDLATPSIHTLSLPGEFEGLFRQDDELFWSLAPNLDIRHKGKPVITNDLGVRNSRVGPKEKNEYRILSVGESTTFGDGVAGHETYTAVLETLLNKEVPSRRFTVINAGVPAYSSFQSLKYIELRGLKLEPDMILFYHELNDYLPSSLRGSISTEISLIQTDKELYESKLRRIRRAVTKASALVQWLSYQLAKRKMKELTKISTESPLGQIGMPDIGLAPRTIEKKGDQWKPAGLKEDSLPRRVNEQERIEILDTLFALCKQHGIDLVIIHPAYNRSTRHECLLTSWCRKNDVAMFEAFDSLHPDDSPMGSFYRDWWHPNTEGHSRLAKDLSAFIQSNVLAQGVESAREIPDQFETAGLASHPRLGHPIQPY